MCDIIHKRQIKLLYRLDSIYNFTKLREKGDKMMDIILGMTKSVVNERKLTYNSEVHGVLDESYESNKPSKKEGLRDDLDDIDENDVGKS